ncbi:Neutral metalloprotease precursor [Planctomycetes bacterium Pan216]|uniref:Neutral metalloprotease n=1 Tax=Kolteria novifilia TaxID=2527975 RepID=A0A518BC15_9BACT|nr:Neutral metalloprotease precursor [Planctomycetes bacterium Pan216]
MANVTSLTIWWLLLAATSDPTTSASLRVGEPFPVATTSGTPIVVDLASPDEDRDYLVVVASMADDYQASRVTFERSTVSSPDPIAAKSLSLDAAWLDRVKGLRLAMQHQRQQRQHNASHVVGRFANRKSFHLFVKEDNFHDVDNYVLVIGKLARVGKHCLIYVDEDDNPDKFSQEVLDEVVDTFDERILPKARATFGHHRDVDRNGRFTILFTHWLSNLSNGKVSLGGFVRGGDFFRDIDSPYSNQCDMMYLNSNLTTGSHLRTLLAHEYTHAITFSEHVFGDYLPTRNGEDEEAWLNEAISHLAENLLGDGWSNLDYRVSTFLNATHRYPLVVPDYYRAGLWRCHGCRGATYLFLRWCVDTFGEEVLGELTQSNLQGMENLEVATGVPFEELFREWAVSLCLEDLSPRRDMMPSLDLRGRLDTRLLGGPAATPVAVGVQETELAATGFQPFAVHVPRGTTTRLRIDAESRAKLQVTLVRLPNELPRASLHVMAQEGKPDSAMVTLEHVAGEEVTWERLTYERRTLPRVGCTSEAKRAELVAAEELWERTATRCGDRLVSDPVDLSSIEPGELAFKLVGRDAQGRRVTAWGRFDSR